MNMRPSRVLKKIRAGQVAACFKTNLADPRAVEIAAMAGFDCIWTCMEHVANDWTTIERQINAAKCHDVDILVRVSRGGYSDYVRPLELDAAGIMVPHIMCLDDARNVVRMTKFHPVGRRPVDGGNADGAYCNVEFKDYLKQANENRFICVQIEDPEPLDDLEAIAALPGIDMIFFGPGDFTQGIGAPGDFDHPKVIETRRRVAEVCVKNGKIAGTIAAASMFDSLIGMGYRFISSGADVIGLGQYCKSIVAEFQKRSAGEVKSIYGK
jgi:4-hydroxy-2-oxoheptanedioate aldolase